jgi:hypothetical protein
MATESVQIFLALRDCTEIGAFFPAFDPKWVHRTEIGLTLDRNGFSVSPMQTPMLPLPERVPAEIRAEMGFQNKSVADLAVTLGVSRQSAKRRYDGEQDYTLTEVEAIAKWLDVERSQLLVGLHTAVAS